MKQLVFLRQSTQQFTFVDLDPTKAENHLKPFETQSLIANICCYFFVPDKSHDCTVKPPIKLRLRIVRHTKLYN